MNAQVHRLPVARLCGIDHDDSTGEHAKTTEEARADCEENRGTFVE